MKEIYGIAAMIIKCVEIVWVCLFLNENNKLKWMRARVWGKNKSTNW